MVSTVRRGAPPALALAIAFGLRVAIASGAMRSQSTLVAVGAVVLIAAVAMSTIYLGLLRDLSASVQRKMSPDRALT